MKRSWFSFLSIGGVLVLLTLFLGLQYKWLSEVSEAERDRMQKRVETDVARFSEDFNREMQAAYYNFQIDGEIWKKGNWSEFNERYDFWKGRTPYPELIRDMYFFENQPGARPLKYDPVKRTFEAEDTTPELENLRARFTEESSFRPVYDDAYAMVLPIYHGEKRIEHIVLKRANKEISPIVQMPEKFGWLVVLLDDTILKSRILPELAAKYFPENDYKVAVLDRDEHTVFSTSDVTAVDATAPLFSLSPDNLMFFANRDALPRMAQEHKRGVVVTQRVESHTFSRTETKDGKTGTFQIELQQPGEKARPRTTMVASTTESGAEPWRLRVQHVAGSIDTFVLNERNKSFMIGLGIYLLLVGGIVAILLSAFRSRAFAKRQIDFVSSVSHEFRTPLAVIYSAGENLADGIAKEDGQVSRYGELIKGEGKKLSGMVEQILEFAGASSGMRKYGLSETDVSDVVDDALNACEPLTESHGFKVETEIQSDLPKILADRSALSSAIQNLIANSVKYSNGSKWIKISASNGSGWIRIAVEDKGLGISSDELRRIFEPFYRAKEVVDAQISGNGLGLSLVRKIAEAHGGKVSVDSHPGSGSKFTIEIPV